MKSPIEEAVTEVRRLRDPWAAYDALTAEGGPPVDYEGYEELVGAEALGALLANGQLWEVDGGLLTTEDLEWADGRPDLAPRTKAQGDGWRLVSAQDRRGRPAVAYTVDRTVPATGVGQLFGASYTGKSFVALDLLLTVS